MILTAQRVRPLPGHTQAIHSYFHRHGCPLPRDAVGNIEVNAASEQHHTLVRQHVRLRVGGNPVDSFLDVFAEDGAHIEELDKAVKHVCNVAHRNPASFQSILSSQVSVVFYVSPRITAKGRSISEELNELWLESRSLFIWTDRGKPLTVVIDEDRERWLLYLDEESAARVSQVLDSEWRQPRIRIDHATRDSFVRTYGQLFPKLVPALTGLEPSVVRELGGIQFINHQTGDCLYADNQAGGPNDLDE